jgi:hypothetical protein
MHLGVFSDIMKFLLPIKKKKNSQSAIHLTKNQMYHERTKHIDVRVHFIHENVSHCIIAVKKVATADNPMDMMTKPVPLNKFKHCLDLVGVCSF